MADRRVNILSFVPFKQQHTVSNFVSIPLFFLQFAQLSLSDLKSILDMFLFFDLWMVLNPLYFFRIWDCLQHEEGVGVRTRPVTICIKTDTNLQCALNVAVS